MVARKPWARGYGVPLSGPARRPALPGGGGIGGPSGRLSLSPPTRRRRPRDPLGHGRTSSRGAKRRLRRDRATAVPADVAHDRPVRAVPGADPPAAADRPPVLLAVRPVGQQLQAEPAGHGGAGGPAAPADPDRPFGGEERRAPAPQQLGGLGREVPLLNPFRGGDGEDPADARVARLRGGRGRERGGDHEG